MKEKIARLIAWHLPKEIAYWTYVRVAVHGNKEWPADQPVIEPMKRWRETA